LIGSAVFEGGAMSAVGHAAYENPDVADQPSLDLSTTSTASAYGVIPGLVWAFHIHADGSSEPLAVDQPVEARHDGWLWLHFNLVDQRVGNWLTSIDIPPVAAALLTAHDNHQQLHAQDACIYGVITDLSREIGATGEEFAHLHFAMTERLLISGRYRPLNAVERVREMIEQGQARVTGAAALLELIVDHVADAVDRLADKLAEELDGIEDRLIRGQTADGRQSLANARRTSVKLHRQLAGLRSLFHRLEREGAPPLQKAHALATKKLAQRLDALDHDIIEIRDRARLLQEEMNALTADESQRSLSFLTVITTVFLPPTLVTGFFGMNTKNLFFSEDPDGTLWALGFVLLSAALVIALMKRIGALKF
jgi:zinc transporter